LFCYYYYFFFQLVILDAARKKIKTEPEREFETIDLDSEPDDDGREIITIE
jgi:hypothetical protein